MKLYDLDRDELLTKGESTAKREELLKALDYDGYVFGKVTAILHKDEEPKALPAETADDFVKLAQTPSVSSLYLASTLGRHRLSDEQLASVIKARPALATKPTLVDAVLDQVRSEPRSYGNAMDAMFEAQRAEPNEQVFKKVTKRLGTTMSPEHITEALDHQEKNGWWGWASDMTKNPDIEKSDVERIINPEKKEIYGTPGMNFKGSAVDRLKPEHLSALINRGDFFSGMTSGHHFTADHMRTALAHPQTQGRSALQGIRSFYDEGKTLPPHELAPFIERMTWTAGEDDDSDLPYVAAKAVKADPALVDHLDDRTLKHVVRSSSVPDAFVKAVTQEGIHGGNAPRVERIMKAGGPTMALADPQVWKDVMESPYIEDGAKKSLRRHQAQHFWRDYEDQVKPQHFAAVTKWQTNDPDHVQVVDHRGHHGSSEDFPGIEQALEPHAKESQAAVLGDTSLPIKHIDGKPHVLVYRGVAGDYAHKVADAVGNGAAGVELPTAAFSSWSTEPREAAAFSNRNIPGQQRTGVVMRRWAPVDTVLHSGFHPLEADHHGGHAYEQELVFDHRNEPHLKIPAADIHISHAPLEHQAAYEAKGYKNPEPHEDTHDEMATPHLRKSENVFQKIPLTDTDIWSNHTSELRKCVKEFK